jgi:hypothetical protein
VLPSLPTHFGHTPPISSFPDHLITSPAIPITAYRDTFGNWCSRIIAPQGQLRLSTDVVVNDSGEADLVVPSVQPHPVQDLPEKALWSSSWEADIAKPIGYPKRPGIFLANHPPAGRASRINEQEHRI